jgi:hypothetical protein
LISIMRSIESGSLPAAWAPSSTAATSSSYSSAFFPLVQMNPSPTRPASFAASGPEAAT